MAVKTYTPLLSEVLNKVHKSKTKAPKIRPKIKIIITIFVLLIY